MARARGREAPADLRRVPAHAGRARRAQARARGRAVGHPRTTSTAPLVAAFLAQLPFPLTGDQQRAIAEITRDLAGPAPMHRLLQGDVGSGKTVVALAALLVAVQGGYQGAFMAPTEVLAEQHYLGVACAARRAHGRRARARCSASGRCASSCSPTARPRPSAGASRAGLAARRGRHPRRHARAALRRRASSRDLGLAVIDEQHRFGVEQRALLARQGRRARRARDDGDADPAHRGDARLRRPRQVRAARDAARAHADRDRRSSARARSTRHAAWERAARRGRGRPPGVRRVPARRGQGQARGQGRDRGVRAAAGRGARAACGSGCCTGR